MALPISRSRVSLKKRRSPEVEYGQTIGDAQVVATTRVTRRNGMEECILVAIGAVVWRAICDCEQRVKGTFFLSWTSYVSLVTHS